MGGWVLCCVLRRGVQGEMERDGSDAALATGRAEMERLNRRITELRSVSGLHCTALRCAAYW